MNRKIHLGSAILFLVLITALVTLPRTYAQTSPADPANTVLTPEEESLVDHEATVIALSGTAQIIRSAELGWETLKVRDVIREGNKIRTGPGSSVDIIYDAYYSNHIRIEENTLAVFNLIEPTQLNLSDGSIFNMLDGLPKGSTYEISTPTAVSAVRGTQFLSQLNGAADIETTAVLTGEVLIYPFLDQDNTIDAAKVYAVSGERAIRFEALEDGTIENRAPEPLTDAQNSFMRTLLESARNNVENFAGGPVPLEDAQQKWALLKEDEDTMNHILEILNEHGKGRLLTAHLVVKDNRAEKVVVSSALVGTDREAERQDNLIHAKDLYIAGSDPDEEVTFDFGDKEPPQK